VATARPVVLLHAVGMTVSGCAGSHACATQTRQDAVGSLSYVFVPAGREMRVECRSVARSLRYRVPCLSKVPKQMRRFGAAAFIARIVATVGRRFYKRGRRAPRNHGITSTADELRQGGQRPGVVQRLASGLLRG
jgi:hypothetical protein